MRKTLLLLALAIFAVQICAAQDEESKLWNHEGALGLNMAQSYFENWSAGGTDNVTFVGLAKYNINFKKGNSKWDNALDLGLGYNYFDLDKKPVKTDDKIDLSSLYGYNLSNDKFFATAEFTFKTQFVDGFDYTKDSTNRISGFFIPAYFTLGIGAQWVPNKYFSLNVAPVDCRLTIVNDETLADAGSYGVEKAEYDEEGNYTNNKLDLNAHEQYVLKKVLNTQFLRLMKEPIRLMKNASEDDQLKYKELMENLLNLKEEE